MGLGDLFTGFLDWGSSSSDIPSHPVVSPPLEVQQVSKPLDRIVMYLVPKAIDEDPDAFKDPQTYRDHCAQTVDAFFDALPRGVAPARREEPTEDDIRESIFYGDGEYGVTIGFLPDYRVMLDSTTVVRAPLFTLAFVPKDPAVSKKILESAFSVLHAYMSDGGKIVALGEQDGEVVMEEADVLRNYFPPSTPIEARSNDLFGHHKHTYRL